MSELAAKRKTDRVGSAKTGRKLFQRILKNRWLYLLALPGIAYYILFKYVPMWGLLIAAIVYGVGGGGLIGSRTMAIKGAPEERMGVAGNTYLMGSDLGQTLGPIVFTGIAAMVGGMYRPAYMILGGIVIAGFVIWMIFIKVLMKRHPENEMGW